MTPSTHEISVTIHGATDALESELATYLGATSDQLRVSSDPVSQVATVFVGFSTVEESIELARRLNTPDIATHVSADAFYEPSFVTRSADTGAAHRDVHLDYPGGGRADFRGRPGAVYNLLTTRGLAVNFRVAESTFRLRGATINGTFMSDVVTIAEEGNASVRLAVRAAQRSTVAWCDGSPLKVAPFATAMCGGMMLRRKLISYTLETPAWQVRASTLPVYDRISGGERRVDVALTRRSQGFEAHGLLGQGYNGKHLSGAVDVYPTSGRYTTSAWAEGAIEGSPRDYEVDDEDSVTCTFGRFHTETRPRA